MFPRVVELADVVSSSCCFCVVRSAFFPVSLSPSSHAKPDGKTEHTRLRMKVMTERAEKQEHFLTQLCQTDFCSIPGQTSVALELASHCAIMKTWLSCLNAHSQLHCDRTSLQIRNRNLIFVTKQDYQTNPKKKKLFHEKPPLQKTGLCFELTHTLPRLKMDMTQWGQSV